MFDDGLPLQASGIGATTLGKIPNRCRISVDQFLKGNSEITAEFVCGAIQMSSRARAETRRRLAIAQINDESGMQWRHLRSPFCLPLAFAFPD